MLVDTLTLLRVVGCAAAAAAVILAGVVLALSSNCGWNRGRTMTLVGCCGGVALVAALISVVPTVIAARGASNPGLVAHRAHSPGPDRPQPCAALLQLLRADATSTRGGCLTPRLNGRGVEWLTETMINLKRKIISGISIIGLSVVGLAGVGQSEAHAAGFGEPQPPACTGQQIRMYSIAPTLDFSPVKPFVGAGVQVTEHVWYSPSPWYRPGSRSVIGYHYQYSSAVIGQDFGLPKPTDATVTCIL